MPVDTPSPEYEAALPRWQRCRDCFEGSDAVKARATGYLPMLEGHHGSSQKYDAYKTRAVFYNATARTVAGLLGSVFRATPSWTFPATIEDDLQDVTLMGRPLVSFALMGFQELLITGRVGVQVDMPKAPEDGATTRPYWVLRRAEDILSWRTVVRDGQETLTRVVLSEAVEEDDPEDEWSPTRIDQIRVLELVSTVNTASNAATYQIRRFRNKKASDEAEDQWKQHDEAIVPLKNGDPLTFIPFQFIGPTSVTPAIEKSPMVDIVDVNLSHYRTSADFEHGAHLTALPTPWVSGAELPDGKDFPIGSATAWILPNPQARAGMLEFTGDGLKTLERSLSVKQEQMASLGARLIESRKAAAETAEALRLAMSGDHSVLASMASTFDQAMTHVMRWHADWSGADTTAITFAVNKDFFEARLTAQEAQALVGTWQAGGISFETLFWNLQAGEWIEPGRTIEQERALIAAGEDHPGQPASNTE